MIQNSVLLRIPRLLLLFLLITGGCTAISEKKTFSTVSSKIAKTATVSNPTATRLPSSTLTLSAKKTQSVTPRPTETPHPMVVEVQRAIQYPGSEIVIEDELSPGSNYRRYYASYRSDGLKIYGLLTIPQGEKPEVGWPAIVFNHGYIPPEQYRTTERYVAYVDRLARAGYIVFRIDYRGHDQSEGVATGAYSNPGYLVDVLNAVSSLKRFPQTNPDRIGMWGHSMGGYLTLRAMVVSKEIKAGVIWAGVVGSYEDLMYNWRRSSTVVIPTLRPGGVRWRDSWVNQYGTPEENPDFWNSISSNSYLAELSGPVQLHHGTADTDVPVEFSTTLAEQIESAGGYVELFTYQGDNHNLSNYFTTAMNRTIEFYDRFLKQ